MNESLDIVGLCGSLRASSFNAMALRLAGESLPAHATLEVLDWRAVPPFDADVLARGMPPSANLLRERIRKADEPAPELDVAELRDRLQRVRSQLLSLATTKDPT